MRKGIIAGVLCLASSVAWGGVTLSGDETSAADAAST
jgi:hypothetical protein